MWWIEDGNHLVICCCTLTRNPWKKVTTPSERVRGTSHRLIKSLANREQPLRSMQASWQTSVIVMISLGPFHVRAIEAKTLLCGTDHTSNQVFSPWGRDKLKLSSRVLTQYRSLRERPLVANPSEHNEWKTILKRLIEPLDTPSFGLLHRGESLHYLSGSSSRS